MTTVILTLIFILLVSIGYRLLVVKFNYDPAEEFAIGFHTGDVRMATIGFIKVLIITLLLAALLRYSLLAILELAIIVVSAFE